MPARGPAIRLLPRIDQDNRFFWTSGSDGRLRFLRCQDCRSYVHPPSPVCPFCLSGDISPEAVSGRATLVAYTCNVQEWIPGSEPYLIGLVAIDEQEDVRSHHQPGRRRARRGPRRHGRRGRLRAARGRLPPPVPAAHPVGLHEHGRTAARAPGGDLRHRPVGHRPAPRPQRPGPDRRGVPGRRARRRTDPRRHRRAGHLPGNGCRHCRLRRAEQPRGPGRLAAQARLARRRRRGTWPDAGPHRRLPGRRGGPGPPRACLPDGDRVHRPGNRRPSGHRWKRRWRGRRRPEVLGLPAVVAPFRGRLRRQLDRPGRPTPHARVLVDQGAAGPDRPQRPAQRRPQPRRHLLRSHGSGQLPRRTHDLDPSLPLRLRRPLRRVDGLRRLPSRLRTGHPSPGLPCERGGHRAAGADPAGTSSTT